MTGTWSRILPWAGVVAVALFVFSFAIGGEPPDLDDPVNEVVSFYTDEEGSQFASAILAAYGALFLLFFAGALWNALRRPDETNLFPAIVLAAFILMAAGISIFAGLTFTLADGADDLEPAAVQAIHALNMDLFIPLAVGVASAALASGIAILRGAALPRWLGFAAIVIGIVSLTPAGFFAFLAFMLWIAVASIVLGLAARTAPPAATPTPPVTG